MTTTRQDLKEAIATAQLNIKNFIPPALTPVQNNSSSPPRKIIPPEQIQNLKTIISNKEGEELSNTLYDFLEKMIDERAFEIAQNVETALTGRINELNVRLQQLERSLSGLL